MDQSRQRIFVIDTLRGLAALVVVFWHFRWLFGVPYAEILLPFYTGGWVAVDLFFVLSGFILTKIYFADSAPAHYFKHFMVRRLARIYPLHLLTLIFTALLLFVALRWTGRFILYPGYPSNDAWHFVLSLLLLQGSGMERAFSFNGPAWSISTEMIVNVFLILIVCFVRPGFRRAIMLAILLSAVVIRLLQLQIPFLGFFLVQTCLGFFPGCLLALGLADLEKTPGARRAENPLDRAVNFLYSLPWRIPAGWISNAIFAGCVVAFLFWMVLESSYEQRNMHERIAYVLLVAVMMPLMLAAAIRSTLFSRLSATFIGRWLGNISYSVYLWHFPVAAVFYLFVVNRMVSVETFFLIYFVTVLIVADISYRWFEWPARQWIIRRFDRKSPEATGVEQKAAAPNTGN